MLPLWCDTEDTCPLHCLKELRFWPYAVLHLVLFYGSALAVFVLKQLQMWPKQFDEKHYDKNFDSVFYVAHHIPMTVMSVPLSNTRAMYGPVAQAPINEAGVWFTSFLATDTLLITIHSLGGKEIYVHHCIFAIITAIFVVNCACPFTAGMLIAQEFSTPPLNAFLLLRVYKGLANVVTQATFLLYALLFYIFRIVLNTFCTVLFIREVFRGFFGSSGFTISQPLQFVTMVVLVGGAVLQFHWGIIITKKIYEAVSSGKSEKAE